MTREEAFDCGAYARMTRLDRDMCPNFKDKALTEAWNRGFDAFPKMHQGQKNLLKLRKTGFA